jgi:hypothetical protein
MRVLRGRSRRIKDEFDFYVLRIKIPIVMLALDQNTFLVEWRMLEEAEGGGWRTEAGDCRVPAYYL